MKTYRLTPKLCFLVAFILPALTAFSQSPEEKFIRHIDTLCSLLKFEEAYHLADSIAHPCWMMHAAQGIGYSFLVKANDTKLPLAEREENYRKGCAQLNKVVNQCDAFFQDPKVSLYRKQHLKAIRGVALFNLGHRAAFFYERNLARADSLWEQSLATFEGMDTTSALARGHEEPALEHERLVNRFADGLNLVKTNFGKLFQQVGLYEYAIREFSACRLICQRAMPLDTNHWQRREAWAYQNLAEVYIEQGNYQQAFNEMVICSQLKRRLFLKNKSILTDDYINGLNTFARTKIEVGHLEEAFGDLANVDSLLQYTIDKNVNKVGQAALKRAEVRVLQGRYYMKKANWPAAEFHLKEALARLDTLQERKDESYRLERDVLLLLRDCYKATGRWQQALFYQTKYDILLTTALNLSPETKLNFYADKLNRQKDQLKTTNDALATTNGDLASKNSIQLVLMFAILILAGAFIAFIYRYLRKRNELAEVKNTMLISIYHDLRNPSGKIRTEAKDALANGDPEWQKQKLQSISDASMYLENLAETLLQYNKDEVIFSVSSHRLCDCCNDAIRQIKSAKGSSIEIANNIPPEAYAEFDENHLTRVFMNLISNAIKAINARNNSAPSRVDGCIEINLRTLPGEHVRVEVHDNGIGIQNSRRDVYMLKDSTGVGLKYCELVINGHQGSLGLEKSAVLKGACAYFTLVASPSAVVDNAEKNAKTQGKALELTSQDCRFLAEKFGALTEMPFYRYSQLRHELVAASEKATTPSRKAIKVLLEHLENQRENTFYAYLHEIIATAPASPGTFAN